VVSGTNRTWTATATNAASFFGIRTRNVQNGLESYWGTK
jgi:hypothetical protein